MKFSGLILICASSCLALLLPAIGVVKFPKVPASASNSTALGAPVSTTISNAINSAWQPATSPSATPFPTQIAGNTTPVLPGASGGASMMDQFSTSMQTNANTTLSGTPAADPSGNKLGLGIWLLLGPVCLIGLGMWSLAPNPSGSK